MAKTASSGSTASYPVGTLMSNLRPSSANQRSTRLSHDELVGVKWKWKWKREWRINHCYNTGVLWVEEHDMDVEPDGTALSMSVRTARNSAARCRWRMVATTHRWRH